MIGYDWRPLLYGKYTLGGSAPIQSIRFCRMDMHCRYLTWKGKWTKIRKVSQLRMQSWAANGWCSSFNNGTARIGATRLSWDCVRLHMTGFMRATSRIPSQNTPRFSAAHKLGFSYLILFCFLFSCLITGPGHLPGPLWRTYYCWNEVIGLKLCVLLIFYIGGWRDFKELRPPVEVLWLVRFLPRGSPQVLSRDIVAGLFSNTLP